MKGSIIKGLSKERKNSSSIANNLARLSYMVHTII